MNPTVQDIERPIALVLMVGTILSVVLLLIGIALLVLGASHGAVRLLFPLEAIRSAASLHADGWLSLGILVLILTPVLRVIMAIGSFAWIRDWRYVVVSTVVLAAMAAALLLGV